MILERPPHLTPVVNFHLIRRALTANEVLTDAQLSRHGLSGQQFPSLTLTIRPHSRSDFETDVTFRVLDRKRLRTPQTLAHSAGLAEIRQQLHQSGQRTLPLETWAPDRGGHAQRPDATLHNEDGELLAVEMDSGYAWPTVRRKMRQFSTFTGGIIWGTTSAARTMRIKSFYPEAQVLTVDYWSSSPQTSSRG